MPIWYQYETSFVSGATLSTIYGISHLLTVILELPTGVLADLLGRKLAMSLGTLINAGGWLLMVKAQGPAYIWLSYLVNGLGTALISGADVALYYDSLKELNRSNFFSKFMAQKSYLFRIGMVAATYFGIQLFEIDKTLPYFVFMSLTLLTAFLTSLMTEPKLDSEKFSLLSYWEQTKIGVKQLSSNSYIRDFSWFYVIAGGISWYFVYFLNQAYITKLFFNLEERGVILSLIFTLVALFNYLICYIPDLKRKYVYLGISLLLASLSLVKISSQVVSLILILFGSLAGILRFSLLNHYANDEFKSKYRATAGSTLNLAVSVVFTILSLILSPLIKTEGIETAVSVLGLIGLFFITPTLVKLLTHS